MTASEIGARNVLAGSYLELGHLNILKERPDNARECILKAIELYEECKAEDWLKKAKADLASLK